jgi:hypothetical protein
MLFVVDVCPIKTVHFLSNVSLLPFDAKKSENAAEIAAWARLGRSFLLIAIKLDRCDKFC